ncbi:uncharacterized protein F4822DRAFT_221907 [Hypoxylon trugodes]|uniref:uncharacterized protein n=1 Tax=Hypoxylon trugodes TaxID=326681 RepID=UPI002191CD06|nr:uncharacterized protein F4822DRAFT_221907 [Hypoxylon trugodes]KAI1390045.1 hypothetical protein F4822DRAFT_221907 [Hypoxylon trugodes]
MAPTGGQRSSTRPNGDAKVSDVQVAASNSTLNTWVGGRRQPAWLVNAKPAKPTPRPPPQPQKPPINPETTSPIVTAAQPASVPVSAPATTPAPPQPDPPSSLPSLPSRSSHPPLQTQTSTSAAHPVLPSPAPSDEPSPDVTEPQITHPVTQARFVLDSSTHDHHEEQVRIRESTVHSRASSWQSKEVSIPPRTLTPTSMALNTPPTPNLPPINTNINPNNNNTTNNMAPREAPQYPPAKRRRVGNPSQQFIEASGASRRVRERMASIGGEESLEMQVERPRYQLLLDACNEGDLFFIALHQLFCAWAISQASVHRLCDENVHNPSLVDNAFGTMGTLLKSNSKLRQDHLQWFAGFPAPLQALQKNPLYQNILRQVLNFLVCVAHTWMTVHRDHQAHGYPLLVSEMVEGFFLFSPILQGIMFRASRRSIGVLDGPLAVDMETLFRADQNRHRDAVGSVVRQAPSAYYQHYNTSLIKQYQSMIAQSRPSGVNYQGMQHFSPSGSPTIPQTGIHHPLAQPQVHHQMSRNPSQASGFQPGLINSDAAFGNMTLYSQSPVNTPPAMSSPSPAAEGMMFPAQFVAPSAQSMPSSPATMAPLPSTLPSQPVNQQPCFNQQSTEAGVPPVQFIQQQKELQQRQMQQQIQHQQQMQLQFAQQSPHLPPTSPHLAPNAMGPGRSQNRPMQPICRQPQGQQNSGGHPGSFVQRAPNTRIQVPNTPGFTPNAPPTPQLVGQQAHFMNQYQGPSVHAQPPQNPQLQLKGVPVPPDRIRFVPSPNMHIPVRDYPHSPYDRHSIETSLHQVNVRSPKRIPLDLGLPRSERYYQAVKCFALSPVAIPPHPHLYNFTFTISESDHAKITRNEMIPSEIYPVNLFSSGSLRVRVRCCYRKKASPAFSETTWVTADTKWPEHMFMEVNQNTLTIMRGAHYAKDTPAEASSFVMPGENSLSFYSPKPEQGHDPQGPEPCLAVEIVETLSHSAVLEMVRAYENIPASVTREIIGNRLRGTSSSDVDNDELAMVDYLSIDLADPFVCSIFKIPVRGAACTHLECFDLETWLNTRLSKKSCHCPNPSSCANCPNEPSFVDKWKCPLCDGDARPYSLRIDAFLVEVRSQLESDNKLRTKSILVSADGTWKPKEEPDDDDSDVDSEEETKFDPSKKPSTASSTPFQREKPVIEVIELD